MVCVNFCIESALKVPSGIHLAKVFSLDLNLDLSQNVGKSKRVSPLYKGGLKTYAKNFRPIGITYYKKVFFMYDQVSKFIKKSKTSSKRCFSN